MNFRQLVFKNILRNARVYLSYFLSSVFSIFVFFTAAILYFHPALEGDFFRWKYPFNCDYFVFHDE